MWIKFKEWLGFHVHDWHWDEPEKRKVQCKYRYERSDSYLFGFKDIYDPHLEIRSCQRGTCNKCGMVTWRQVTLGDM